ncbi:hypothetical protein P691DRAFT_169474 [Macrolepiota fuliginosa MF-IS2]|uniref:Uncharacterized protein n=1 Tax=Macrolepiota fuliginosa MF-IS2 TaxID=1400762 RepID=A0A9P6BZW9_9AGAR|nr:hypothetical protein P691DRAFT_169474 [Macrolepiota fuliginosa MF-IS2]
MEPSNNWLARVSRPARSGPLRFSDYPGIPNVGTMAHNKVPSTLEPRVMDKLLTPAQELDVQARDCHG